MRKMLPVCAAVFLSTPSARRATRVGLDIADFGKFLSTPSARRATPPLPPLARPPTNFYPRPPRGGRRFCHVTRRNGVVISIHALREEGDWTTGPTPTPRRNFYPRPPRGGRRETRIRTVKFWKYFYPRPPRGGRLNSFTHSAAVMLFLSTPSARRATLCPPPK